MSDASHPAVVFLAMPNRWDPNRFQPVVPPEWVGKGMLTPQGEAWIEFLYTCRTKTRALRLVRDDEGLRGLIPENEP